MCFDGALSCILWHTSTDVQVKCCKWNERLIVASLNCCQAPESLQLSTSPKPKGPLGSVWLILSHSHIWQSVSESASNPHPPSPFVIFFRWQPSTKRVAWPPWTSYIKCVCLKRWKLFPIDRAQTRNRTPRHTQIIWSGVKFTSTLINLFWESFGSEIEYRVIPFCSHLTYLIYSTSTDSQYIQFYFFFFSSGHIFFFL